jgi:RNA polymerase sigma-70 factor (ECF subfamily)
LGRWGVVLTDSVQGRGGCFWPEEAPPERVTPWTARYILRRGRDLTKIPPETSTNREDRATQDFESSDGDLILRVAAGDEASLATLYDRYAPLLLAVSMRILGDRGEAEDAVQRVYIQIWRDAKLYDSRKAPLRVWLLTCVRHSAIDLLRRREVASKATRQAAREPSIDPSETPPPPMEENQKRLVQAIETLPVDQKEAIDLAYFEGLSQTQIAARLNEPLGTVKTRIRLGMAKLREALTGFSKERK